MAIHAFSSPIVAADVLFVAPMFGVGGASPAGVDNIDTAADTAERLTNREEWGDLAGLAASLMAAHLLWLEADANQAPPSVNATDGTAYAGAVTSENVGGVSRSFGARASGFIAGGAEAFASDALATSPFGKRLIGLRGRLFVGAVL